MKMRWTIIAAMLGGAFVTTLTVAAAPSLPDGFKTRIVPTFSRFTQIRQNKSPKAQRMTQIRTRLTTLE
jgi:hypothetical protein